MVFRHEAIEKYTVFSHEAGIRLDVFLAGRVPNLSRSQVRREIDEGQVWVNSGRVKASHKLKQGDIIYLQRRKPKMDAAFPEDIPLKIVYEDPHLLVVDKPAGMVVHPAAGNYKGTLVNALLYHCKDLSGIGGVLRPGIVHRLDKQTSGLMLVAKSDLVHKALALQFKQHEIRKVYRALVYGDPKEETGLVDAPVGRHPTDRKKMSTKSRRGKEALTHWYVCERYGVVALLDVELKTGRTHQIRVHLSAVGYPVVGDFFYGSSQKINSIHHPLLRSKLKAMHRQALHAAEIGFVHPVSREPLSFSSALPSDMAELCDFLRQMVQNSSRGNSA